MLNIRFLDSMLYCQSSLASFAQRYSLPEEKGYFPHALSGLSQLKLDRLGLPPFEHFSPAYDKKEARVQKRRWYDSMPLDYHWNYQQELTV